MKFSRFNFFYKMWHLSTFPGFVKVPRPVNFQRMSLELLSVSVNLRVNQCTPPEVKQTVPTKTQLSNFLGTPGEDYFKGNPKSLNFYFLVIWWGKQTSPLKIGGFTSWSFPIGWSPWYLVPNFRGEFCPRCEKLSRLWVVCFLFPKNNGTPKSSMD